MQARTLARDAGRMTPAVSRSAQCTYLGLSAPRTRSHRWPSKMQPPDDACSSPVQHFRVSRGAPPPPPRCSSARARAYLASRSPRDAIHSARGAPAPWRTAVASLPPLFLPPSRLFPLSPIASFSPWFLIFSQTDASFGERYRLGWQLCQMCASFPFATVREQVVVCSLLGRRRECSRGSRRRDFPLPCI